MEQRSWSQSQRAALCRSLHPPGIPELGDPRVSQGRGGAAPWIHFHWYSDGCLPPAKPGPVGKMAEGQHILGSGEGCSFLWVSGTQHFHPQSAWSSDAPGSWLTELWGSAGSISCWRPRPPAPVALIKEGIMTPCSVELGSGAPKTDKALCSFSAPCGRAICMSTPVCGSAEDQSAQGSGGGPLGGVS